MRLLIVASSFPPVVGGAESYAAVLARGMAERGHAVTVATDTPYGWSACGSFADPAGVTVKRFAGYRRLLEDASKIRWEQMTYGVLPELATLAEECRPQLILTNSLDASHLGKMLALELDLPWAAAFHEHAPEDEPMSRGRLRFVYGTLRPSVVLAGSELYAARAARWGPDVPVRLIHHGVDTEAFSPRVDGQAARHAYGFERDDLIVVCAGRLKARKGMRELVGAFHRVYGQEGRVRLLIIGTTSSASPDYAAELERDVERLRLREVVTIDRSVTFDQMPSILAGADVVAQPSWEEGLGLSVLEAMSVGKATVTTDVVGVREILAGEDVALVVPPKQEAALAGALGSLLSSATLRRDLGARARRHVVGRFSRDLMLEVTEDSLTSLLPLESETPVEHV